MSIVFAAITPHPPLLIPSIGKNAVKQVEKTQQALGQLEQQLYLSKPDIIAVISPHGNLYSDSFTINAHTRFIATFEQFGDLTTKLEWQGAPDMSAHIGHMAKENNIEVQLISDDHLDHGAAVPLSFLTPHLPHIKILPIGYSELSQKQHFDFGYMLKEAFMESDKRVALIASGDLSHGLTTDAPAGYSKVGEDFDKKIIELLEAHNSTGILTMDAPFVEEAAECGYRSILILLGVLKNMEYTFKNYAYEGPFGVGYLTGEFILE